MKAADSASNHCRSHNSKRRECTRARSAVFLYLEKSRDNHQCAFQARRGSGECIRNAVMITPQRITQHVTREPCGPRVVVLDGKRCPVVDVDDQCRWHPQVRCHVPVFVMKSEVAWMSPSPWRPPRGKFHLDVCSTNKLDETAKTSDHHATCRQPST